MKIVRSISSIQNLIRQARRKGQKVGFVPTMGALHEGHASLLRQARRQNDLVVLSIFVNPTQFGPKEDLKKYPRTLLSDEKLAKKQGVDIIFYPSAKNIYPTNYLTYIEVNGITNILCGASRPGHFKGVATIVAKLLNIVSPDVMYLGQKDAQQVIVLKKMMTDLNFSTTVKVCPTIRESDGIAMSSRNRYLNPQERQQATVLYQSLQSAKKKIQEGEKSASKLTRFIKSNITNQTSGIIDYVSIVDAASLKEIKTLHGKVMIALAVKFGSTRLIDNMIVSVK